MNSCPAMARGFQSDGSACAGESRSPRYVSVAIERPRTANPPVTSGRFNGWRSVRRSRKVLEELEQAQEVPLGTGHVGCVGWIRDRVKRYLDGEDERQQDCEDDR